MVATTDLAEKWWFYVPILGLVSTIAGFTGYFLGKYVASQPWVPRFLLNFATQNKDYVEKYGVWAVALGALTPFPFSITCWSAGFLRLNFRAFALGALARFPRIIAYYWIIHSAQKLPGSL